MAVKLRKDVRELVQFAKRQGFTWNGGLTGSGHVKLKHRNGGVVVIPATPSAYSWRKNAVSDLAKVANGARDKAHMLTGLAAAHPALWLYYSRC